MRSHTYLVTTLVFSLVLGAGVSMGRAHRNDAPDPAPVEHERPACGVTPNRSPEPFRPRSRGPLVHLASTRPTCPSNTVQLFGT